MFNDLLTGDSIDTADCKVQGGAHQSLSSINLSALLTLMLHFIFG
jgi:hypothetical protein